jgi:hypothetical protein
MWDLADRRNSVDSAFGRRRWQTALEMKSDIQK